MPLVVEKLATPRSELKLEENEQVMHTESNIKLYLGDESKQLGRLFLTNKRVVWICDSDDDFSKITIDYPYITMHAICRDEEAYSEPCIYCQLDPELDESDADQITEVRFAPSEDNSALETVFKVFSECSALHPDQPDCEDDGETGMLRFTSEQSANEIEEDKEAAMNQQQVLEHLDNLLIEPTTGPEPFEEGQFSD